MSKSASSPAGLVELLDEPKVSAKKIRSAVTDTGREVAYDPEGKPGVSNLLVIFSALSGRPVAELQASYEGRGYGDLKSDLADELLAFVTPVREQVSAYLADPAELDKVLAKGAERARAVAAETVTRVYDRVGFLKPTGS
jgi:tryptophanyl-tRNA synthetase